MRATATSWTCVAAAVLLAVAATAAALPSIEPEPVKVTHHNSGPRYDIDIVGRTRLPADAAQEPPTARPQPEAPPADNAAPEADISTPLGRVTIRRIFLFPMRTGGWDEGEAGHSEEQPAGAGQREREADQLPTVFAKPFWPFMTPARHPSAAEPHQPAEAQERPHRPHLFGADEASRSPADTGLERDQSAPSPQQVPFDPIQMMIDLMQQAVASQVARSFSPDLNREAPAGSNQASGTDNAPAESADERPQPPAGLADLLKPAKKVTSEDVVEIDGKKYLRKTVVNQHFGENVAFVTRRLIFVPLNETEAADATTTASPTTTEASASTADDRVGDNKPEASTEPTTTERAAPTSTTTTTTTSTTTSSTTSAPTSSASPEPPTSTSESKLADTPAPELVSEAGAPSSAAGASSA